MQITITNNGSTWSFRPLDDAAKEFLRGDEVGAESWQFLGDTLVMDHRPARDFVIQAEADGVEFVS